MEKPKDTLMEKPVSDVIDVRSFRRPKIDSDHYLVVFKIRARLSNVLKSRAERTIRFDIQRLKADGMAAEYASKLDQRIAIESTAREVVGTTRKRQRNSWFDAECQTVTDENNQHRSRMLTADTRQNTERYTTRVDENSKPITSSVIRKRISEEHISLLTWSSEELK